MAMDVMIDIPEILRPPRSSKELDIPMQTVEDLVLRRAYQSDRTSVLRLSQEIALSPTIVHECFEDLRARQFLDVLRLDGNDYHFTLTTLGRERAGASMERCGYNTFAPVSLSRYNEVVMSLRYESQPELDEIHQAYGDLVIQPKMLDRIGPAFTGQASIFFYGPAGTGKTSLAERLISLYDDCIVVPHAVEIDGQLISVYDPTVHKAVPNQPTGYDPRWMVCERPLVVAGGELELGMLQLKRDPVSRVYSAPLQMKANNGIFLVDDFGRQLIPASALLNRWIVPLERRIDYLSLDSGMKFAIPFEVFVVFSTNIDPNKLGDDAFFRRIQNKIFIGPTTIDDFDLILDRSAAHHKVELAQNAHQMVRMVCREFGRTTLVPCYPGDIVKLVKSICDYAGEPRVLDRVSVWKAAELYFTSATNNGEQIEMSGGQFTDLEGVRPGA
jgi:hypothetical protein